MPKKNDYVSYKSQRATELEALAILLNKNDVCSNVSPLYQAASMCRGSKHSNNTRIWGYEINNLIFNFIQTPRHTYPVGAKNLNLELSVEVTGNCDNIGKIKDPLDTLGVNIIITGTNPQKSNLKCAWHLDRHIEGGVSDYPHPTYHIHYGGNKIDHSNHKFGDFLMLDSPRLSHYPLDGILAIDFVVSNYFPEHWRKLKSETQYLNIVRDSQKRIWQPYAHTCAFKWLPFPTSIDWNPELLLPQLVA